MLPLMTQGGPAGLPTLGAAQELPRPAGLSPAPAVPLPMSQGVPADFSAELESVDELLLDASQDALPNAEVLPVELPRQADDNPSTPASAEPEQDVEQWLLSMLSQRDTQVHAHDNEPLSRSAESTVADATADALSGAQLLNQAANNTFAANNVADSASAADPRARMMGASTGVIEASTQPAGMPPVRVDVATAEALNAAQGAALDRAIGQGGESASSVATATTQAAAQSASPERTLTLQGPEHKWGEQMLHALRESVDMQVQQRLQSATIRLDPPELGSMEIFLSHESGRLSVQISAAQVDVARLLQNTSERLRQELIGQNFMQVSVGVSSEGQPGRQSAQQGHAGLLADEPVIAANGVDERGEQAAGKRRSDVLITV